MYEEVTYYYQLPCDECAREYITCTTQSYEHKSRCGFCVARNKLARRQHPEDIRDAQLDLSRWLAQQGAYLRIYAYQDPHRVGATAPPAGVMPIDAGDDEDPF